MQFWINLDGKLVRANYILCFQHFEFDDGRPPLVKGRRGSVVEWLRWQFRESWIMDEHGRSYPPLADGPRPG